MVETRKDIAVLFPGQGAQYVGMGKTLADEFPLAASIFEKADQVLGFPISDLIFNGPEEELTLTKNSQPAIYITSWAAYKVLEKQFPRLDPWYFAGLSLGEYTAYAASEAFSFEDGLKLVRKRGELMQKCTEDHPGTMASVMGLPLEKIDEICIEANKKSPVNVANINSPGQVVISGSIDGVKEASDQCAAAGAKRVIELKVSGAFHSSLMQEAADGLAAFLPQVEISAPGTPVISNVLAKEASGLEEIKTTLARQVTQPVLWAKSMEYLKIRCVNIFIECGPGKVLRGLLKRIVPDAITLGVEDGESLEKTIAALEEIYNEGS